MYNLYIHMFIAIGCLYYFLLCLNYTASHVVHIVNVWRILYAFLQVYGDIEYTRVIKDRSTGENKGLAYVKYFRAYHAALAVENCDPRKYCIFSDLIMQHWLLKIVMYI